MPKQQLKKLLRWVINEIERNFPKTIAAFEGFVISRERVIDNPYAHIEVFNVSEYRQRRLQEFINRIISDKFRPMELSLTALMWTEPETHKYFRKDVVAILKSRNTVAGGI